MRVLMAVLLLLGTALLAPAIGPAFHEPSLSIGSGNATGAYYVAASALTKVFNRKSREYGVRLTTVESEGSPANIDAVLLGKRAFGIAQADVLQSAARGLGAWEGKPQEGLRAVLGLHVEVVTIVAASDRRIEKVADLRGKRVNIGAPGSSDHQLAPLFLEAAGVPPGSVTFSERSAVLAAELLQKREIDAYIYTVGHPNLALLEASAGKRKVRLIPLDLPFIEHAAARNPLVIPAVIAMDHYPGLEPQTPVPTIGVRAVLFTRADMAGEMVHRLARDVLANYALFQRQHPVLHGVTPREACGITVIPYHPEASRACREGGLLP